MPTDLEQLNPRCIEWRGGCFASGYGRASRGHRAHRWAYQKFNGPIPAGMVVMHTCDNRVCVNPFHLRLGTDNDNVQDAKRKGRMAHQRGTHCNQQKTRCPKGHLYDEKNTRTRADGRRYCGECSRQSCKRWRRAHG